MSVQFVLDLIDKTSSKALSAAGALAKVESQMQKLVKLGQVNPGKGIAALARGANGPGLPKGGAGAMAAATKQVSLMGALGEKAKGIWGSVVSYSDGKLTTWGKRLEAVTGPAEKLGGVLSVGAMAGVGLVGAGALYAAHMSDFKEDTLFAFKNLTGSQEKGMELWTMADQMARSMAMKTSDVAGSMRDLMSSGFAADQAKAIVAAEGDILAMNSKVDIGSLNKALAKMQGQQKFSLDVADPIFAAVSDDLFYEKLGNIVGTKNRKATLAKISAGAVTDQQGLQAILESVQAAAGGGPLGSLAATKGVTTTKGAVNNAMSMVERLVLDVDTSPIGKKIAEVANWVARATDPAGAGRGLLGTMSRLMAMVSAGATQAQAFVRPLGEGLMTGLSEGYKAIKPIIAAFTEGGASAGQFGAAIKPVATALGYVAVVTGAVALGLLTLGGYAVAGVGGLLTAGDALIGWAGETSGRMWIATKEIGHSIIDGITQGIASAKASLMDTLTGVVDALPKAVRSLLDTHSPSRVFAAIGTDVVDGMSMGIGDARPPSLALASVMAPKALLSGAGGAAMMSGRGAVTITIGDILITAPAGADADGIGVAVRRELLAVLEGTALSSGAMGLT